MATLNFVGGEKGGVGKSIIAMTLIAYYTSLRIEIVVCEADRSNGDVGRVVEGKDGHIILYLFFSEDRNKTGSADSVLDALFEKNTASVISCPSQSSRAILQWFEAGSAELAIEEGINVNFWFVTDGSHDSMKLFLQSVVDLPNIQHILVRNTHYTQSLTYDYSNPAQNPAVATALEKYSVPIVNHSDLGPLGLSLRHKSLTYTEAIAMGTVAERGRVRKCVRDFAAQIDTLVNENAINLSTLLPISPATEPAAAAAATTTTRTRKSNARSNGGKKRSAKSTSTRNNDKAKDSA